MTSSVKTDSARHSHNSVLHKNTGSVRRGTDELSGFRQSQSPPLRRLSSPQPAGLIVVDREDKPVPVPDKPFPIKTADRVSVRSRAPNWPRLLHRVQVTSRRGSDVVHVIDTKWKRLSSRMDDAKQGVSQADVYRMMAYGQLYRSPRLTLLYPHHSGLGVIEGIHGRHRVTERDASLETASFDVADGQEILGRLRRLLFEH